MDIIKSREQCRESELNAVTDLLKVICIFLGFSETDLLLVFVIDGSVCILFFNLTNYAAFYCEVCFMELSDPPLVLYFLTNVDFLGNLLFREHTR